jgi:L-idonate 5-dehydrogenase
MIACVIHGARELKIENRPEPPHPQDGEVLVRFGAGGICGSDLHYYHEGGILDFKIREPLVLGHEVAGEVVEIGPGVTKVSVGQRVAVNPLRSCLRCVYCLSGRPNLCLNRRFFGSAARFPHVQGMFAELFIASEAQCVTIPELTPFRRIDIGPILTGQFSLGDASSAFELASDRSKAMKVSLVASA